MMKNRWKLGAVVSLATLLLTGGGALADQTVTGQRIESTVSAPVIVSHQRKVLHSPQKVTLADNGDTVIMPVGARFLLNLGGPPPDWRVTVRNQVVLSRVVGVMVIRGAQGIYQAKKPGKNWLQAVSTYPCQTAKPPCMMPSRVFRIYVVVKRPNSFQGGRRTG